jgi:hypothetical protein
MEVFCKQSFVLTLIFKGNLQIYHVKNNPFMLNRKLYVMHFVIVILKELRIGVISKRLIAFVLFMKLINKNRKVRMYKMKIINSK